MIERKEESKSARSVLLEDFNDIDIYVEDTAIESKKIYREILKRVFKDKYNIEDIFPIGSCASVISEWEKHKENSDSRKKIFIIDGDFILINDDLKSKIKPKYQQNLDGLYVLPRYCIENFLIDKNSLISVTHDEDPLDDIHTIESKINFEDWILKNEDLLIELFIIYSIVIKNNIGIKTIKFKITNFYNGQPGVVCKDLIRNRINYLKEQTLFLFPEMDFNHEIRERSERIIDRQNKLLRYISGKDYLMPLIKNRITQQNRFNPDNISLKIRLAKKCDVSELNNISEYIFQ
jgi:hypothetical protein